MSVSLVREVLVILEGESRGAQGRSDIGSIHTDELAKGVAIAGQPHLNLLSIEAKMCSMPRNGLAVARLAFGNRRS